MRQMSLIALLIGVALLILAACGGDETPEPTPTGPPPTETPAVAPTAAPTAAPTVATSGAVSQTQGAASNVEPFDPATFGENSAEITNQWAPMKPGARYTYEGTTVEDDGTVVSHTIVINVTDLTKVISGIRSRVSWDLDYSDGELVEAELAFFAQDKAGTIWQMGEYPEEYDTGKLVANPGWIHGIQDAQAGILMQADPQPNTPSYSEGWGPAVNWTDRGQVDAVGQKVCVPLKCYENVLVIAEANQSEKDALQLKSYAAGVGNVHVGWRGSGEKVKEVLELTKYEELTGDALTEMRTNALKLEQNALTNGKALYGQTTPIELPDGVTAPDLPPVASNTVSDTQTAAPSGGPSGEVVVYAADLPESMLSELEIWDDPASPSGKLLGIANTGTDLDAPPEVDPHVDFPIQVQEGVGYRCWLHMKVGAPKGIAKANLLYVQFDDAVDQADNQVFAIGSASFLTAQGPEQEGWLWVPCEQKEAGSSGSLVYFGTTGAVTVRIQAGMEGVGFDQFVLSGARFVDKPPTETVVAR